MRDKTNGRDLVRTGATRFATAFLTSDSLQQNQEPLRYLFCGLDWTKQSYQNKKKGNKVCDTVLSLVFWSSVNDCVDATLPLLQVLRNVDGDERPASAEIVASIDYAKDEVKKKFGGRKIAMRNKLLKIIKDCWNGQMGKPLHGAALFLNPGKYFDLLEKDPAYASRIREDFNDVLEKMVKDKDTRNKISNSADTYKNSREGFAREMTIEHRKIKVLETAKNGLHILLGGISALTVVVFFRFFVLTRIKYGPARYWTLLFVFWFLVFGIWASRTHDAHTT